MAEAQQPKTAAEPSMFGSADDLTRMYQMITGFEISQIVHAAARYSLAEHLRDGRATSAEIAEAEAIDASATFRLLRVCASIGLVSYDGHGKFAATPLLDTLHKDHPHSLRGAAELLCGAGHWLPWGQLCDAIATGKPQAEAALGCSAWEHMAKSPRETAAFEQTMKSSSWAFNQAAARLIDTRTTTTAVDVGGANGTLVHALMERNPALSGVVFDLPHIVPGAVEAARQLDLSQRFSAVPGSFFDTPVPPGDLLLLKLILHDWDDAACIEILKNCRRALQADGRLVVAEQLLDEIGKPGPAPLMDLDMLVMLGGKERSLGEFNVLFAAAGFRLTSVTRTATPFFIIEARAA